MNFAPGYLVVRFFFRIGDFFHHWYVDSSRWFFNKFISFLEGLDRFFGVKINLANFFRPLYGDYTIIGRAMGVIFRTIRIVLGSIAYVFFSAVFLLVYLVWALIPPAILFMAFKNFP